MKYTNKQRISLTKHFANIHLQYCFALCRRHLSINYSISASYWWETKLKQSVFFINSCFQLLQGNSIKWIFLRIFLLLYLNAPSAVLTICYLLYSQPAEFNWFYFYFAKLNQIFSLRFFIIYSIWLKKRTAKLSLYRWYALNFYAPLVFFLSCVYIVFASISNNLKNEQPRNGTRTEWMFVKVQEDRHYC